MKTICILIFVCIPTSLFAQFWGPNAHSAEMERRYNELYGNGDVGRNERINHELQRIEENCNERIQRIREWTPQIEPNKDQSQSISRGGIQIVVESQNYRLNRKNVSQGRSQQAESRRKQREAHQAWLKEREEQWRYIAEKRRRRIAEERRQREQKRSEIIAYEYMREGERVQRLSDEAYYRTHQGADILNQTHTASMLMRQTMDNNFGNGATERTQHRIRPLKRRTNGFRLDPNAIPWATMNKNAQPWENWRKNFRETYLPISIPEPEVALNSVNSEPRVFLTSPQQWEDMERRIPPERFDMIRAVIYDVNKGVFPSVYYDAKDHTYKMLMLDQHRIMVLDEDGSRLAIQELKEKNASFSQGVSITGRSNILGTTLSGTFFPFQKDKAKVSSSVDNENFLVSPDKVSMKSKGGIVNYSKDSSISYSFEKKAGEEIIESKSYIGYEEEEQNTNLESHKNTLAQGSINLNAQLIDSPQLEYKTFYFGHFDNIAWGYANSENGPSVVASAKTEGTIGLGKKSSSEVSLNLKATLIEGSVGGSAVYKIPGYDGVCFSEVNVGEGIGFQIARKRKMGKSDISVSYGKSLLFGLPVSFSTNATIYKCHPSKQIKEAFEKAKKQNNNAI